MRRVYLDNAGSGIASPQQLEACAESMKTLMLSNPHSRHATAQQTHALIENARLRVLKFLNAAKDDYYVIFTSNTTSALKLIAETFQYNSPLTCPKISPLEALTNGKSTLLMLRDSHTSVVGMREYRNYEQWIVTDFDQLNAFLDGKLNVQKSDTNSLFVLTAMSNFCGRKYNLSIIDRLKEVLGNSWSVCLDAAAWIPCSSLNLTTHKPDFVAFSFYKLFGFPTGVAALLIRRDRQQLLHKRYFGGGTIETVFTSKFDVFYKQSVEQRFEDGTLNFHSIAALKHGFDDLDRLGGIHKIERHCMQLTKRLYTYLLNKKHGNGKPIAKIYGWNHIKLDDNTGLFAQQGDIVNFNLLRDDGSFVGFVEVEKMCDLFNAELRTGCHCNQGACSSYLCLDEQMQLKFKEMGKTCHDEIDLIDNQPLGSIRISLGRLNTMEDVEIVEQMIECCFVNKHPMKPFTIPNSNRLKNGANLSQIFLYPIKSGGSLSPQKWQLSKSGLRWDRNWMVVGSEGLPLTQKRYPALCYIQPEIVDNYLVIKDRRDRENQLKIQLDIKDNKHKAESSIICVNSVEAMDCGSKASDWLCNFDLPTGSRLVQMFNFDSAGRSFSNQADYLLLTKASVEFLAKQTGLDYQIVLQRFRANFVIETMNGVPFEEDEFDQIYIGSIAFKVIGKCTRCQMICVDQETGQKDPNVLLSLRDTRAGNKITFGVYLSQQGNRPIFADIVVGSFVHIERKWTSN